MILENNCIKLSKLQLGNPDAITWDEKEGEFGEMQYCYWYGEYCDPENMIRMFGLPLYDVQFDIEMAYVEIHTENTNDDGFSIYINRDSYEECVKAYIKYYKNNHEEDSHYTEYVLECISNIKPLPKEVDVAKAVQFQLDFTANSERDE